MIRSSRSIALASCVALSLLAPVAAHAQFGGLINKAKEKVAQKAEEKAAPVAAGEQLTADLVGSVVRGAQAADRVLGERDRVTEMRESKNKEYSALMEKNQPVHRAYNEANSKILDCRSASFSALEEARSEKNEKRLEAMQSDPAMMGKVQLAAMKYGPAMAEAQQKNDPVALTKVQREYFKEILGVDLFADTKQDSVKTDAKCGKVPTMPAALAQEEKLRKDVSVADDSIRTLEAKAVNIGASASGLEQVRYLMLKERTLAILNKLTGQTSAKFGEAEMEAVKSRQADLEKVKRAL